MAQYVSKWAAGSHCAFSPLWIHILLLHYTSTHLTNPRFPYPHISAILFVPLRTIYPTTTTATTITIQQTALSSHKPISTSSRAHSRSSCKLILSLRSPTRISVWCSIFVLVCASLLLHFWWCLCPLLSAWLCSVRPWRYVRLRDRMRCAPP